MKWLLSLNPFYGFFEAWRISRMTPEERRKHLEDFVRTSICETLVLEARFEEYEKECEAPPPRRYGRSLTGSAIRYDARMLLIEVNDRFKDVLLTPSEEEGVAEMRKKLRGIIEAVNKRLPVRFSFQ